MSVNQIKVAVLGLGYMGQNHLRLLASGLEDAEVTAICDIDSSRVNLLAKKYNVKAYENYKELINSEILDMVFICLPTSLHYEVALYSLNRKISVFIEKPVCATIVEAKKLIAVSKKNHTAAMVGHIERFNPVVAEIKHRIESKELGKLLHIHTQRFSPPPLRSQDVSAITDLATHDIDVINYLTGQTPLRVYAETERGYHKKEDLMSALLRFKSGLIGLVEVSWLHPTKIRNITVVGENGMYTANYLSQELLFYKQNQKIIKKTSIPAPNQTWADVIKIAFKANEPLAIELKAFLQAIKNKQPMPVTLEEGLKALTLTEKITFSGSSHRVL